MKPHHDFQAERMVAVHCEELLARAAPRVDMGEDAQSLIERACGDFSERLRGLLLGSRPAVTGNEARKLLGKEAMQTPGAKGVHYAVSCGNAAKLLVSLTTSDASRLTDRLFGGDGAPLDETPDALPLSAMLALQRMVTAFALGFCKAADVPETKPEIEHDADARRIAPFDRAEPCIVWTISIAQNGNGPWELTVALAEKDLAMMLEDGPANTPATHDTAIFDEIPLPVSAVLAQMKLPLERLAALRPGDIVPIAASRTVPLLIAGKRIAEGRVGTFDDRVALQLTHIQTGQA